MFGPDFTDADSGYYRFVDLASFVDFFILNELSKNVDGYRLSTFMYKDRDGKDPKLHTGPIWDFNIAFGNADYYHAYLTGGWQVYVNYDEQFIIVGDNFQVPFYWEKLLTDTVFVKRLTRRWQELRSDILSENRILNLIDSYVDTLNEARQRNFKRWSILGRYVWPNYYVGNTYIAEINYLKSWITDRLQWMDEQLFDQIPPQPPSDLRASEIGHSGATLSWNAGSDNVGVVGYDVYHEGRRVASTNKRSVKISDLADDQTHLFTVASRDFAGNLSVNNPQIEIRTLLFSAKDGVICPAASQNIIVDGIEDFFWRKLNWVPVEKIIQGSVSDFADFSAKFKIAWDYKAFYLLVRIYDDRKVRDSGANYQLDDDLEVYFDSNNSKSKYYDADDFKYRITFQDSVISERAHNAVQGVQLGVQFPDDGYVAELSFPWTTLRGKGAAEKLIGFEIQLNDDDDGGTRDAKISWWGSEDIAYRHPSAFGQVKLKGNPTHIYNEPGVPLNFELGQNRPNPFNGSTIIPLYLKQGTRATLEVFDILGRKVKTLQNGYLAAGSHEFLLKADEWASGIYFFRLTVAGEKSLTKRMLLIR